MDFLQLSKERYSVRKFDLRKLEKEKYNIPEFIAPVALLPLGYPGKESVPHPLHKKRFDVEHTVFYNTFGDITHGEMHGTHH